MNKLQPNAGHSFRTILIFYFLFYFLLLYTFNYIIFNNIYTHFSIIYTQNITGVTFSLVVTVLQHVGHIALLPLQDTFNVYG